MVAGRREENTPYHHHPPFTHLYMHILVVVVVVGVGCSFFHEHVDVWHAGLMAARCIRIAAAAATAAAGHAAAASHADTAARVARAGTIAGVLVRMRTRNATAPDGPDLVVAGAAFCLA